MCFRSRRLRTLTLTLSGLAFGMTLSCTVDAMALDTEAQAKPLNVLLITVDDMNCDSVGIYGCPIQGITPNIDKLASQGMRFEHGHVTIAICQPTRAVWMTGRYPHRNGALGFDPITAGVPTLLESLKRAGYHTGILAKVSHVIPTRGRHWDVVVPAKLRVLVLHCVEAVRARRDDLLYVVLFERANVGFGLHLEQVLVA